jgi:hypothetical protein
MLSIFAFSKRYSYQPIINGEREKGTKKVEKEFEIENNRKKIKKKVRHKLKIREKWKK